VQNILERLELQANSFQESFTHLSKSRSLEQLAKSFFHILRGSLLVTDASVFFKARNDKEWKNLFSKNGYSEDCLHYFAEENSFSINTINHNNYEISITLPVFDRGRFGILIGQKLDNTSFTDSDRISLQFFLQQLNSAYQFIMSREKEKQLIFSLNHRVLQLNSLIDTGIEVSRLQEGKQLLELALERVLALTNASHGMLRVKQGRRVVEKLWFPDAMISAPVNNKSYTISTSFKFGGKKYTFYLFEKESRRGIIEFDSTDQLLLDAFARQVHVSLENHYLHQQSLEKELIDQEISVAGSIQKKLIPEKLPDIEGYELCGINAPTKFIGGDYYECIPLNDGRFLLIMADVSGKGVAAGLLVSTLHASAHAYVESPFGLESLVQRLNEVIFDSATVEKYITAFFALFDPKTGTLESVNAGHNPTYILRKNRTVDELKTGGIPLGMMRMAFPYEGMPTTLKPGDSVLLYTDGITEAMNAAEEEYDDIRPLKNFLLNNHGVCAADFIDGLIKDINDFTGDTPQSDDITALYFIRKNS